MTELKVAFRSLTNAPKKKKTAEHSDQCANISPLVFSRHPLRIQGRAPIILSEVVRNFSQPPYSTFKYPITVSILALSSLPNPITLRIIKKKKKRNCCSCCVIRQPAPQQIFHEIFLTLKYAIYKNCVAKAVM